MIRSRRAVLAAVVVVLGLSACGDPNTTTPLADGPKVIELASGQAGSGAAEAAPAAATIDAADTKMAFFGPTEFVYDGELPALDAPAGSWFFATGQQPDLDRVAQLAAALGVEGDVRALPEDQGGGWAAGPLDYSGAVLTVSSDGMLSWWLSAAPTASVAPAIACGEVFPVEPDAGTGTAGSSGAATDVVAATTPAVAVAPDVAVPDCSAPTPAPQPPAGVPTKDEALAKARQLFADWGYDVDSYEFDVPYADEWGASVNASLLLEGMKAPIMLSVGFGENGVVTYASGSLATPERGDDYPTIGAAAGLERLKTQQNQYIGLDSISARSATGVAAIDVAPADVAIAPDVPSTDLPCEPEAARADCAPTKVEPVTVTLNSVRADLIMQWAADNTIWLLPAYSFGSAEGGFYTVIAVDDAYIQEVDPPIAISEPAVTALPGSGGAIPTPDTVPAVPASTCLSDTALTVPPASIEQIADTVVGHCLADAEAIAKTFRYELRVVTLDGVSQAVTDDINPNRINVVVDNDTVTSVSSIG
jgi:hypothetical protein